MSPEEEYEFERSMKNRPHVVILGAGATMASIPNGDKNGRKSSVMNGFIEALGMTDILKDAKLETQSNNLEDIYSELYDNENYSEIRKELDKRIRNYFSKLELPEEVNIYDLLLLSLKGKDLIATFNWDPLLLQAYQRACRITRDLPDLAFLHGNVLVGYCRNHKYGGILSQQCAKCNEPFSPVPLLYPVTHKNYSTDPYINDNWKALKNKLRRAYIVTIFGYSAPNTDKEAISIMEETWGDLNNRYLEDIEIIDIQDEDKLISSWRNFIHSHHYKICNDFFSSSLAKNPRRTTVEFFDRTMNAMFTKSLRSFVPNMSWGAVKTLISELLEEEDQLPPDGILVTHAHTI
ncbi:hypothetical protein [Gluconobacter kondonii]|uniref:hypothetical protein n=1 Tax=Gluconobacter kondonii TaxID=941463 RepID=UPI001B8AEDAD|nr:hypothetical protein [Gluconobacter kondonii]MBS1058239.1 hypothetical protein [Gluconobacter kondonii]